MSYLAQSIAQGFLPNLGAELPTGILVGTGLAMLPVFIRMNAWLEKRAARELAREESPAPAEAEAAGVAGNVAGAGLAMLPVFIRMNAWLEKRAARQRAGEESLVEAQVLDVAAVNTPASDPEQTANNTQVA